MTDTTDRSTTIVADQCRDAAAQINARGGNAHVYRQGVVVVANTAGTWTLLLPSILPDVPFVATVERGTEAEAHAAADAYFDAPVNVAVRDGIGPVWDGADFHDRYDGTEDR